MKIKLILIVILAFTKIWAGSIVYDPPYKFDPNEYIFIGKVIAHIVSTGIEPKNKFKGKYHGFLVDVDEEIYLPEKTKKHFEIYPLSLSADNREGPYYKQYIEIFFPIGSKVRIVAKKTKIEFENSDELNIQLEVSPYNQFTLSLNLENVHFLISTKESIYNYENTNRDSLHRLANRISDSLNIKDPEQKSVISYSVVFQKDFELRKDLYRLYKCTDDKEKVKIVYRLKNFRYLGSYKLINIVFECIQDKMIRNRVLMSLFEIREKVSPIEWIIRE